MIRRVLFLIVLVFVILAVGTVRYGWKPFGEKVDYNRIIKAVPAFLTRVKVEATGPSQKPETKAPTDNPTDQERKGLDDLLKKKGG